MAGKRELVLGICAPGIVEVPPDKPPSRPVAYEIDTSDHFYTEMATPDRDELIRWAREIALKLKFAIVIGKSDNGSDKRKQYFRLDCERGGRYVSTNKKLKSDQTGTRKCGCPFRLRGYCHADKTWHLTVVNGKHNHELDKAVEGHLIVGRLKPEERQCMEEMSRNLVPPKNIMSTLKDRDPNNKTTAKQLYNLSHRLKLKMRASMTEMQHLSKRLVETGYFFKHRTVVADGSEHVQDIFFAHPKSISLFNSFPTVLLMDSTYKTNKYKMPLFEIVGFTSTGRSFNVGFAWLTNEREDNFTWALEQCVSLLRNEDVRPKVIVTDRDLALMNAVSEVFPTSAAMVCRFHVKKNVSSKMKEIVKIKNGENEKQTDVWDQITDAFNDVLESPTEKEYADNVMVFRELCARWPKFLRYVEETVLDTDKERVVNAWVDQHMHMGNHTTNRAESCHGVLKGYLKDGNGDLVKGWEAINKMLISQFTEVQGEFGRSMSVAEHRYDDDPLYAFLFYKISRKAMDHIYDEANRVEECGMDSKKCGCVMRRTYGLPCACLIAKKIKNNKPIRLDEIHPQWKKLCFEDEPAPGDVADDYDCLAEWKAIQERLKTADVSVKNDIRNQLRLIAYPETTSVKPPLQKAKTKGARKKKSVRVTRSTSRDKSRWEHVDDHIAATQASQSQPTKSKPSTSQTVPEVPKELVISTLTPAPPAPPEIPFINHMPKFMHPFIEDIIDVEGDGYCGYRVVALHQKGNQQDYELIRLNMERELRLHKESYVELLDTERYKYVTDALFPPPRRSKHAIATKDKWFTFPDMGYVVATHFQRVVVQLSNMERCGASRTCFPLRGKPPSDTSDLDSKIICIGALADHFVLVRLKVGCLIPPTAHQWKNSCSEEAAEWEPMFLDRMQKFGELLTIERAGDDLVTIGKGSKDDPLEL
ncbi:PKS-NRPS hybrid synthetase cheA-like [Trifolium pratense]|nr:PKS-NRPS hybrid synthetase cheA-like [Trifolium pratense]